MPPTVGVRQNANHTPSRYPTDRGPLHSFIPGDPTGGAAVNLAQDFFDPYLLNPQGVIDPLTGHVSSDIDAILKGDADGDSQAMDALAIREVRNLLFANGGLQDNGQDLIARDIERARDDGIGTYNDVRAAFGLPRLTSFAEITSNVTVQKELQQAYGSVDNIDPFVGGIAEDHVAGSNLGPLFQAVLVNQFTRLETGDRFFYLNEQWSPDELSLFRQGNTLAKVIEANTGVTNLQGDVFLFQASISGTVFRSEGRGGQRAGAAGITVQLQDSSGDVLATSVTDRQGRYSFNQLSGPAANVENASGVSATGYYQIVLVLPPGLRQTTPNPGNILISRGGANLRGANFGISGGDNASWTPGGSRTQSWVGDSESATLLTGMTIQDGSHSGTTRQPREGVDEGGSSLTGSATAPSRQSSANQAVAALAPGTGETDGDLAADELNKDPAAS
jgi:hypothetical protein